jgi:hypothetical protein
MWKQRAGRSETSQSLHLYFVSLLSFLSMHTTHLLLECFLVPVEGLRSGKCLPENLPVGSGGNDLTSLTGMASEGAAPLYV